MKILFEECPYKTQDIKDILGTFLLPGVKESQPITRLKYVGYFYNKDVVNANGSRGDIVFILPTVLLDKIDDEHFNALGIPVKDYLSFNLKDWKDSKEKTTDKLTKGQLFKFVYGFSTWIYRAISIYRQNKKHQSTKDKEKDSDEAQAEVLSSLKVKSRGSKQEGTFVDVMLSLLDFQREHRNFIMFVMKTAHSGFNKINWTKTISHSTPILQDGTPIYTNLINKKKVIDFDEELLVLYYSILNYIHTEYGFPKVEQPGYEIIKGKRFESLLSGIGKMRLRKIKKKYFSDNAVLLWNLCYAFFDHASDLKCSKDRKDYLLVNSFHSVFEAMVDELLGDKDLPEGLKVHGDDKRIDHLYSYKYLLEKVEGYSPEIEQSIYNIADSKYYRRDKGLKGHDVPKQFTYARNVIQWHMDLLNDILYSGENSRDKMLNEAERFKPIRLFDEITEGYNVIPNFFVSALVDDELDYNNAGFDHTKMTDGKSVENGEGNMRESYQFEDRLFDRDSLFTLHYDVNFLYLLKCYAQNRATEKAAWKQTIREKVREDMLKYLNNHYDFYQILISPREIPDFVNRNFRQLLGKVFAFGPKGEEVLLYARRNPTPNNPDIELVPGKEVVTAAPIEEMLLKKLDGAVAETVAVAKIILGTSEYSEVDTKDTQDTNIIPLKGRNSVKTSRKYTSIDFMGAGDVQQAAEDLDNNAPEEAKIPEVKKHKEIRKKKT